MRSQDVQRARKSAMTQEKPSALVRAYVEKIGPTASQVAST